jgi:hypothetical protein
MHPGDVYQMHLTDVTLSILRIIEKEKLAICKVINWPRSPECVGQTLDVPVQRLEGNSLWKKIQTTACM